MFHINGPPSANHHQSNQWCRRKQNEKELSSKRWNELVAKETVMSLDSHHINGHILGRLCLGACQKLGDRACEDFRFHPSWCKSGDVQSNKGPQQPKNRFNQPVVQCLLNTYQIPDIYWTPTMCQALYWILETEWWTIPKNTLLFRDLQSSWRKTDRQIRKSQVVISTYRKVN